MGVRYGIGGSQIAAAAGLCPYRTPRDLWAEILGRPNDVSGHHIERGTHLGPALVRWWEERSGERVDDVGEDEQQWALISKPDLFIHRIGGAVNLPSGYTPTLCRATPDGLVYDDMGKRPRLVIEAKSPDWRSRDQWGEPGTDQIPAHYIPQVMWEMGATGARQAVVVALLDGDLLEYRVDWDQGLFDWLMSKAEEFWSHVESRTPPPDAEAPEPIEYSKIKKGTDADSIAPGLADALADYARLKAEEAEIEAQIKAEGDGIRAMLASYDGATWPGGKASYKPPRVKKFVDWEALALHLGATPDTVEQFTKEKLGARVLRVTPDKEAGNE